MGDLADDPGFAAEYRALVDQLYLGEREPDVETVVEVAAHLASQPRTQAAWWGRGDLAGIADDLAHLAGMVGRRDVAVEFLEHVYGDGWRLLPSDVANLAHRAEHVLTQAEPRLPLDTLLSPGFFRRQREFLDATNSTLAELEGPLAVVGGAIQSDLSTGTLKDLRDLAAVALALDGDTPAARLQAEILHHFTEGVWTLDGRLFARHKGLSRDRASTLLASVSRDGRAPDDIDAVLDTLATFREMQVQHAGNGRESPLPGDDRAATFRAAIGPKVSDDRLRDVFAATAVTGPDELAAVRTLCLVSTRWLRDARRAGYGRLSGVTARSLGAWYEEAAPAVDVLEFVAQQADVLGAGERHIVEVVDHVVLRGRVDVADGELEELRAGLAQRSVLVELKHLRKVRDGVGWTRTLQRLYGGPLPREVTAQYHNRPHVAPLRQARALLQHHRQQSP